MTPRQTAQRLDLLEIHIFPVKSSESVINDDTITKASKRTSSPLTLSTVVWDSNAGNVDPGHYRYTYTLSLSSLTLPWPAIFREQPFTSSHHWPVHHFGNIHFPHFWAENIAIFLEGVRNVGFKVRNPPANCLEGRSFSLASGPLFWYPSTKPLAWPLPVRPSVLCLDILISTSKAGFMELRQFHHKRYGLRHRQ